MISAPAPALYWTLAALFACLVAGSLVRFVALRKSEAALRRQRFASLLTWWLLAIAMSAGLLAGRVGVCLLLGSASCIAWSELTRMFGARAEDRLAIRAGYGLIVINYLLILFGAAAAFAVFLPLGSGIVFAVALLCMGEPKGYIRSIGALVWGMLFLGYGVSHAALLLALPAVASGPLGAAGWFLYLVVLTEANDISQAIVGRAFGAHNRHRIAPVISPNKTWEGFIGGMLVTMVLSLLLAPWLTTLGEQAGPFELAEPLRMWLTPALVGLLLAVAGFFGDINMAASKRDSGVKDSSKLLPGMGGMIDRINSLSMTGPLFVYFLLWWLA